MRFEYLVPTVLRFLAKMLIFILIVFVLLNLVAYGFNRPMLSQLANLVQESVRKNGYLPEHDRKEIQNILDMYSYQARNFTGNTGLPGVNRIITNLRIQVYDLDGNGYSIDPSTLHSYDYSNNTDYYFAEKGKEHKKQQGTVLFAGISCDYLIITPMNGWDIFQGFKDKSTLEADDTNNNPDNWFGVEVVDVDNRQEEIVNNSISINTLTLNNSSASPNTRSLFISPVITSTYYPDLDNNR